MSLMTRYRASGADLPFGDPLRAHGLAMEGYFWRFTDPASRRTAILLAGINDAADGGPRWATLGAAMWPSGAISTIAQPQGYADPDELGARAGDAFDGSARRVRADWTGPDGVGVHADIHLRDLRPWPRRSLGGSSIFQAMPGLNQYWHPWLLGGRADGILRVSGDEWRLDGVHVYGEKNWGKGGFPDAWWWGQAHGFAEPEACVAFAGGLVHAGPLRTTVTALVVRLPDGTVVRLGDPVVSPVQATVHDTSWRLRGRGFGWQIDVDAAAPLADAHVLPVPLPRERRNTAGAIEHLGAALAVTVRRSGRLVWSGESRVAALEHGGLARAEAELRRRGRPAGATDAAPERQT